MDNSSQPSFWTKMSLSFSVAPIELIIFAFFSFIVMILYYSLSFFGSDALNESIVKITGWVPGLSYTMSWFFAFALIFIREKIHTPIFMLRIGIIVPLAINIIAGICKLMMSHRNDFNNSYLKVSLWPSVWIIVLPALWIVILLSPRIKRFCELPKNDLLT